MHGCRDQRFLADGKRKTWPERMEEREKSCFVCRRNGRMEGYTFSDALLHSLLQRGSNSGTVVVQHVQHVEHNVCVCLSRERHGNEREKSAGQKKMLNSLSSVLLILNLECTSNPETDRQSHVYLCLAACSVPCYHVPVALLLLPLSSHPELRSTFSFSFPAYVYPAENVCPVTRQPPPSS